MEPTASLADAIYRPSVLGPDRTGPRRALSLGLSGSTFLILGTVAALLGSGTAAPRTLRPVATVTFDFTEELPPPPPPAGPLAASQPVPATGAPAPVEAVPDHPTPLTEVASTALTVPGLTQTLRILAHDLRRRFGVERPRIAVCGLNPHAGERGHLGREEIDVIAPAIAAARAEGLDVEGPLPADTLFTPARLEPFDAVLAMFHDQGLPVLKYAGFGQAVNVTLGLPIVRTSVDHGTAYDLAGTGRADAGSLRQAVALAAQLARTVP